MTARHRAVALLLSTWMWAIPAYAHDFHPLETDNTGTVAAGSAEIDLSGSVEADGTGLTLGTAFGIHVGLAAPVEMGATFFFEWQRGQELGWVSGFADTVLDLKWRLAATDDEAFSLAIRADYLPQQFGPRSSGAHDVGAVAIASGQAGSVSMHVNAGAHGPVDGPQGGTLSLLFGAGVLWEALTDLQLGVEAFGELWPADGTAAVRGLVGAAWQLTDAQVFTLGVGPRWSSGGGAGIFATAAVTARVGGS